MKKTTPESKPLEANDRPCCTRCSAGTPSRRSGTASPSLPVRGLSSKRRAAPPRPGSLGGVGTVAIATGKWEPVCGKTVACTAGKWEPILRENGSVYRGEVVMWLLDRIQAPSPRLVDRGPSEGAAGPPNCWSQSNRQDDYGIQARSNDCTTGSTGRGCGLWSRCGRSFAWPRRTSAPR